MSAIVARFEPQRARLWVASALAVLLAHLAIAALLLLHVELKQPILRGSADALEVELVPASALPASSAGRAIMPQLPQEAQPVPPVPRPQVAAVNPVNPIKPLPQLQPIPQPAGQPQPPDVTPANIAASVAAAATASVLAAPDLTVRTSSLGQADAPPSPEQAWLTQVIGQLQRYKSYPRSAMKRRQQDTVMLQFSVNRAGQVVYSKISSKLHYKDLEDAVAKMLRLAAPLPAPPPQLAAEQIEQMVISVPVGFSLITSRLVPAPANCVKPADPGPPPVGAPVSLEAMAVGLHQMQVYRERLKLYLGAAHGYLDCVGRGTDAAALAARSAAFNQANAIVDRFNKAQAQALESAREMQAQQAIRVRQAAAARLAQAQAAAARAYAACTAPTAPRPAGANLTADTARSYRRQLVHYQDAVRVYVTCVQQAQLASATQAGNALTAGQRAVLDRTAVQLANAVVLPFNQLVVGFNSQLKRLQQARARVVSAGVRKAAIPGEEIRAPAAFFPNSTWDTPAPLPAGNCFSIVRVGPSYQAQLCKGTYVTEKFVHGFNQAPGGLPVILGTDGVQPNLETAEIENSHPTTTAYAISQLQVSAAHVVLTINRKSDVARGAQDNWDSVHFDLVLSADGNHLVGHCWTEQKRWDCQLPRHH